MIIESKNDVFFEDAFPYKQKEDKIFGKRTRETVFRDEVSSEPIIDAEAETAS